MVQSVELFFNVRFCAIILKFDRNGDLWKISRIWVLLGWDGEKVIHFLLPSGNREHLKCSRLRKVLHSPTLLRYLQKSNARPFWR